jgi:hypothetical protein
METLARIERRLNAMKAPEVADMTKTEFAKKAGISVDTLRRRIADATVITRNGRVPASELRKFLS